MISSRIFSSAAKFCQNNGNKSLKSYGIIYRGLTSEAKETALRRAARSKFFQKSTTTTTLTETPLKIGQLFLAGSSVLGLGALAYYGLGLSNERGFLERSSLWPALVRERISATYGYFGAGLGITALSAVAVSRSPALMALATSNSLIAIFASFAAVIGAGMLVRSIPYEENKIGLKQFAWALHAGLLGAFIAPITLLGGPIIVRAAWYTAGLIGGLSIVAATAPSEKFLNMSGPLAIGLGGVFAASIGSMFFPPTTRLGLSLYSVSIYGGLVLFSLFLLYDTQRIVKKAEHGFHFDPINESVSIYLNTINIFIRIAQILAMGGHKKK